MTCIKEESSLNVGLESINMSSRVQNLSSPNVQKCLQVRVVFTCHIGPLSHERTSLKNYVKWILLEGMKYVQYSAKKDYEVIGDGNSKIA